eukprot:3719793-Rhodomonas_salina.5
MLCCVLPGSFSPFATPSNTTIIVERIAPGLSAYAMSGIAIASDDICLRARYAMPGTDLASIFLLSAYAHATRCPVLTKRRCTDISAICLRAVRY